MLSRSICIIVLILVCGQMLLAGAMLAPILGALHPAWLVQDQLLFWIYEAAYRRWPFGAQAVRPPAAAQRPQTQPVRIPWGGQGVHRPTGTAGADGIGPANG